MTNKYEQRGVCADKKEVHQAIQGLSKGLYKNSFCKLIPDHLTQSQDHVLAMHADGAGTKSSLAYAYWKKTGDISVWKGIAQDAMVMNIDDLLCVGARKGFIFSSTIGRNKHRIPGEVITAIISGTEELISEFQELGLDIHTSGGETADIGDLVKTLVIDSTVLTRIPKKEVICCDIPNKSVIVGLASEGQANYENEYNSGIGSNGLTLARHELLSKNIAKEFPETFDSSLPEDIVYSGSLDLLDPIIEGFPLNTGKALLSPTRTYFPILNEILKNHREKIHGIIHCTGGGQTKILHFANQVRIVKNKLFNTPKLFHAIQSQNQVSWKEMYQVFNMGHRMEIYTQPDIAQAIIEISEKFGVPAKIIGHTKTISQGEPPLIIDSQHGTFEYAYQ